MNKQTANMRAKKKFLSILTEEERKHWIKHKYIWIKRDEGSPHYQLVTWMLLRNGEGRFMRPYFINSGETCELIAGGCTIIRIFDACISWKRARPLPPYDKHALMYLYFKSKGSFWGHRANARVHYDTTRLPQNNRRKGAYSIRYGWTTIPEFPAEVLMEMDKARAIYVAKQNPPRMTPQVNSPVTSSSASTETLDNANTVDK